MNEIFNKINKEMFQDQFEAKFPDFGPLDQNTFFRSKEWPQFYLEINEQICLANAQEIITMALTKLKEWMDQTSQEDKVKSKELFKKECEYYCKVKIHQIMEAILDTSFFKSDSK